MHPPSHARAPHRIECDTDPADPVGDVNRSLALRPVCVDALGSALRPHALPQGFLDRKRAYKSANNSEGGKGAAEFTQEKATGALIYASHSPGIRSSTTCTDFQDATRGLLRLSWIVRDDFSAVKRLQEILMNREPLAL